MKCALLALTALPLSALAGPVIVAVDMDASRPGLQGSISVPAGTTVIRGVAVYVYDPEQTRSVISVGFLGALDRGISFGHAPKASNVGVITGVTGKSGTPVNPANTGWAFPAHDRGFEGPEIQYIELGATAPAPLQGAPIAPIFTVDISLSGTAAGDSFDFGVLDFVSVWRSGMNGSFTTRVGEYLDTGGDSVPDGTPGRFGPDQDVPVPVPPALFLVDFVDGVTGPATVRITCYANCDGSSAAPALNINDFVCFQSKFAAGEEYANCDGSTAAPVLNVNDFICFQQKFAAGCP